MSTFFVFMIVRQINNLCFLHIYLALKQKHPFAYFDYKQADVNYLYIQTNISSANTNAVPP